MWQSAIVTFQLSIFDFEVCLPQITSSYEGFKKCIENEKIVNVRTGKLRESFYTIKTN